MKIAYQPFAKKCTHPADLRRFILWANSMKFDWATKYSIRDSESYDLFVFPSNSNLTEIRKYKKSSPKKVMQIVDGYLGADEGFTKRSFRGLIKFLVREIDYPVVNYNQLLRSAIRSADLLICASPEQQEYLGKYAKKTCVIPDNHSFLKEKRFNHIPTEKLEMVWEGMGVSLKHLKSLEPVFKELTLRGIPWKLTVLTDLNFYNFANKFVKKSAFKELKWFLTKHPGCLEIKQWSEEALIQTSRFANVALVPITKGDYLAELKHECKLLIFWQLGIPTIESRIPSYQRVAQEAELEILCVDNPEQWISKVIQFKDDSWRKHVVSLQDAYIKKEHTLDRHIQRWNQAIEMIKEPTIN